MFRFNGGQVVTKGTYWNLSNGEGTSVEHSMALPGDRTVKYLKFSSAGIFLLGPLTGLLFVCLLPLMSLLMVVTLMSKSAAASDALKSDEAAMCMGCHATPGVVKTFRNKDKLSVHISDSHFKDSVHGSLTCTSCHSSVSMDNHPSAQYASRQAFAAQVSTACKQCHGDEQLMAKPMHRQAITRSNAPPCSECHGSHAIRKSTRWKETASNAQYCLTCHKKDLSISLNGETLSLSIDETILRKSVHSSHECSQCHDEYSKKNHPLKSFKDKRELSIALSGVCSGCHTEKYKQHLGSMHTSLLTQGNRNAPVCTDCHGAHAVGPKALAETLSGTPCRKCHESAFQAYQSSVHGHAKMNGRTSAPICSSCHSAHQISPALASRSPRATCFGCHKEAAVLHKEWLPNAEMHLEAVACTACHVPDVERQVYLRVTDNSSGANIYKAKLKEFLGAGYDSLTHAGENGIEGRQLWDVHQKLGDKNSAAGLTASVGLQNCNDSHKLAPKAMAVKQCDGCHDANSKFFKTVSMAIIAPNGREEHFKVDRAVLGSVMTLLPVKHFYVLGSTRVRLLDILGIVMVFGGMSVPLLHLSLRILTIPIREAKRMNKLRKEGRK
jgi:predicted CXXCH cytochrome family protein